MQKKFFSLREARDLLPLLKVLVGKLITVSGRLEQYRERVQELAQNAPQNAGSPEGTAYVGLLLTLQSYLNQIKSTGCLVKDVQDGLIDFPHSKDGREVYLCWKYGEDDIAYWHEVESGFSGRMPLLDRQ